MSLVLFSLVAAAFLANKDVYIANKFAKLHANRLNKRENITKRFREGLLFLEHCILYDRVAIGAGKISDKTLISLRVPFGHIATALRGH